MGSSGWCPCVCVSPRGVCPSDRINLNRRDVPITIRINNHFKSSSQAPASSDSKAGSPQPPTSCSRSSATIDLTGLDSARLDSTRRLWDWTGLVWTRLDSTGLTPASPPHSPDSHRLLLKTLDFSLTAARISHHCLQDPSIFPD